MSSAPETPPQSSPSHTKRTPPPVPKHRPLRAGAPQSSSTWPTAATRTAVFSKYLMNDIPRGTTYSKLINSLIAPHLGPPSEQAEKPQPHVQCSLVMSDSRLDDELSVAKIEFSDTPKWLQRLCYDPDGFPKKTTFGTLWRFLDVSARDADGRTEFIRAVINGKEHMDLLYPEMLAEFDDVDVNVQDARGRTALHWACEAKFENMVRLCLSVPDCDVGLKDNEGLTAFDISLRTGQEAIPGLFYSSIFNMEQTHPQAALLRVLTFTDSIGDRPLFPGEALFDPIEDRNMPLVTALLSRRVDLTVRNKDGNTALHVAASQVGCADIAKMLLEAGADINAIGKGGATPLQHATSTTDKEMVQVLMDWASGATARNLDERTALQDAGQSSSLGAAEMIDDYPAPGPTAETQVDPLIPLIVANRTEQKDRLALMKQIVVTMLGAAGLRGQAGRDALWRAVEAGDLDSMKALLELGVDTESDGQEHDKTVLHLAAERGHNLVVKGLLAAGARIEARSSDLYTPLGFAAANGHDLVVETLLTAGANIEAELDDSVTALQRAAENGHDLIVQRLITAGANIEAGTHYGYRALGFAAANGHDIVVQTLLAAGADIEAGVGASGTALLQAAQHGQYLIVQRLVTFGANVEATTERGSRALGLAARNGHDLVVQTLLTAGANIEAGAGSLGTPLWHAAQTGHNSVVQTLLTAGPNIEAGAGSLGTPLWHAAQNGHNSVVQTLLVAGADIDALRDGRSSLQLALTNGHKQTAKLLLDAGALTRAARARKEVRRQLRL